MARRSRRSTASERLPIDPTLILVADVRRAPVQIHEGGRVFQPDVALLVRAEDGRVVGTLVNEPGQAGQTFVQALLQTLPTPGASERPVLPGRVVFVNQQLADEVRPTLASLGLEVVVSAPIETFDQLFADLLGYLVRTNQGNATLELADDALKPLVGAAERLWRARPWEYAYDEPPFGLVSHGAGTQALYASILGALREVLGVALYTSLADYETTLERGDASPVGPVAAADEAAAFLREMRQRVFLVTFEAKEEIQPSYRDQLAQCGWSRRLSVVPTFSALGRGQGPGGLTAEEASTVALALDALATFCQRHRQAIAYEEFPLRDSIAVEAGGQTRLVEVSVPPEEQPSA